MRFFLERRFALARALLLRGFFFAATFLDLRFAMMDLLLDFFRE